MRKFFVATALAGLAGIGVCAHASAARIIVEFEDLSGTGLIADGYGGINWNDNFSFYDTAEAPFTPNSGSTVAFSNYAKTEPGTQFTQAFSFASPVLFEGAYFSGNPFTLALDYYLGGVRVGGIAIVTSATPTFLAGLPTAVDEVRVTGNTGNWVMDDVTYETVVPSAVPEPATWAMMIAGFGLAGAAARRRRPAAALA
jgi:hypothetical protein